MNNFLNSFFCSFSLYYCLDIKLHTVPNGARQPLAMRLWLCSPDGTSAQLSACDVSKARSVGGKLIRVRLPGKRPLVSSCKPETGEMLIPHYPRVNRFPGRFTLISLPPTDRQSGLQGQSRMARGCRTPFGTVCTV